jgi:hypothetical protein
VLGAVLAPVVSLIGLPVAAAGIAGLAYRGNTNYAAAAVAVGVAIVGVLHAPDLVFVAPVLAAVVVTVVLLPKRSLQALVGGLVAVVTLASIAGDELAARLQGTTLPATVAAQSLQVVADMAKAMGSSASSQTIASLKTAAQLLSSAWPSAYFESAVFVSVLVVAATVWAARRADYPLNVAPISKLDLSPHILWPFVAGLLFAAAGYASFSGSAVLAVVGLNLLLCVRTLFFIQGFGVVAGLLDRAGVGLGGRIFALAALAVLDAITMVVSFTGLLDFWINFRRLPREGATPPTPALPDDGRRW